jgi:serine/threonine protein phosphatase 1
MKSRTPDATLIYAIGDLHGRLDLLDDMHRRIETDVRHRSAAHKQVVYLGDYVSRGADSPRVVDRVMEWLPADFERVTLKGNHEDLLLRFIDGDIAAGTHWFDYGGLDTLAAYGVAIADRQARDHASVAELGAALAAALPPAHLAFFRRLGVRHRAGDYCFVHGGIRPGIALEQQSDHDCMWIRRSFLDSEAQHGAVIVHGHSISAAPEVRHNRIGIDTGAYRSGVLTCLVLAGEHRSFLQTASPA